MFDVRVQYFAILREKMGTPSQTVPCAPGTTVDELYHGLFGDFADQVTVSYAVNRVHVFE